MDIKLNRELLEDLQEACDIIAQDYRRQTGNIRIGYKVLQLSDIACPKCNC